MQSNLEGKTIRSNVVILHGFNGRADKNWLPWLKNELESRGYKVQTPMLPNTDKPSEEEQVNFVLENCDIDENTILVGHSLGAAVAMKTLKRLPHAINTLVVVAPAMEREFYDGEEVRPDGTKREFMNTFSLSVDYDDVKSKTQRRIILKATNDNHIRADYIDYLADKINAPVYETEALRKHFTADKEPFILEQIEKLL